MTSVNVLLALSLVLLFSHCVSSRWCTRLVSEQYVHTYVEYAQCNRSYQASCGWFTSSQCTYYEMVECIKEKNQTVTKYKVVENCCPGYELDPINNITCIKSDAQGDAVTYDTSSVSVTNKPPQEAGADVNNNHSSLAGVVEKENVNPGSNVVVSVTNLPALDGSTTGNETKTSVAIGTGGHDGVEYLDSDDNNFLGLSHGAYAGIICSLLFVMCVIALIVLHVYKRKRNAVLKTNNEATEMELSEKMIQNPAA